MERALHPIQHWQIEPYETLDGVLVMQIGHNFIFGNTIKRNGAGVWIKSKADTRENAGTVGIVSEVIDADHFRYITGGLLLGDFVDGANYFLSTTTSGVMFIQSDPEVWEIGNVREFIGTGTPQGLQVEIDVGVEIVPHDIKNAYVAYASALDGTGFTLVNDNALDYMAILVTDAYITIPVVEDFAGLWFKRRGNNGTNGRGITSVALISTVGKVKTYRITFTDSSAFDYEVNDGADAQLPLEITGLTLLVANWSLVSGLYEYNLANANITAAMVVDVIPENADIATVKAADIYPKTVSSSGSVKLYAKNAPTANIGVTIILTTATT